MLHYTQLSALVFKVLWENLELQTLLQKPFLPPDMRLGLGSVVPAVRPYLLLA